MHPIVNVDNKYLNELIKLSELACLELDRVQSMNAETLQNLMRSLGNLVIIIDTIS